MSLAMSDSGSNTNRYSVRSYNPYNPASNNVPATSPHPVLPTLSANHVQEIEEKGSPQPYINTPTTAHRPTATRQFPGLAIYRSLSWMLGFREPYSLLIGFIFGGALIGFCLARTGKMSPGYVRNTTTPGEWYWYSKPLSKVPLFVHIYLTIIGGITAVFQFIPAIRRRYVMIHRINGYFTLFMIIPGTIIGCLPARRAFGGEINSQAAFYMIGMGVVFAALMGISNVRETRKHRKWMLRTVSYVSIPITTSLGILPAQKIVSILGGYFAIWRCDEILSVITPTRAAQVYPACVAHDVSPSSVHIGVSAAAQSGPLAKASGVRVVYGMMLWVAMVLHILGVEFYIQMTESSNLHRRGFVLERHDEDQDVKIQDDR